MYASLSLIRNVNIRADLVSNKASVVDVIAAVMQCSLDDAFVLLETLHLDYNKITISASDAQRHLVADATTLIDIVWSLPGATCPAFRRQLSYHIHELLQWEGNDTDNQELCRIEQYYFNALRNAHIKRAMSASSVNHWCGGCSCL